MPKDERFSRFRLIAIIGIALYFLFFYLEILRRILYQNHLSDFYHFYCATVAMSQGQDPYLSGSGGYVYPPLLAFLYLPLAHVSHCIAAAIALTINVYLMLAALLIGSQIATARLLAPHLTRDDEFASPPGLLPLVALLTALVTFGRVKAELTIMQTDVIVLAAYVFAVYWIDRRPALAGVVLGFALNIKYYTLPALFYFLLRRRWRAAAGFAVSAIIFALLPALRVGLPTDLRYLAIAFGGVLKSIGIQTNQSEAAHVHKVYESLSLSITSGIARIVLPAHPTLSTPLTALVIALFVSLAALWYSRRNLPFFIWPHRLAQLVWPFRELILLEWAGLMVASICFSPDSNLRHMVLVLFANAIATTLLLSGRERRNRIPLILAMVLQLYAFDGVGNLSTPHFREQFLFVGGQGWCILFFYGVLLWAGLKELNLSRIRPSDPHPLRTSPEGQERQETRNLGRLIHDEERTRICTNHTNLHE